MADREQMRPDFHGPLKLHFAMRRSELLPNSTNLANTSSSGASASAPASAHTAVSQIFSSKLASDAYARWMYPQGAPTANHFEPFLWWEDSNFMLTGGYILSFSGRAGQSSCLSGGADSLTSLKALLGQEQKAKIQRINGVPGLSEPVHHGSTAVYEYQYLGSRVVSNKDTYHKVWDQVLNKQSLTFSSGHFGNAHQPEIPAEDTNFGLILYHLRSSCCYNAAANAIETAGGPNETEVRKFMTEGTWEGWSSFGTKYRQAPNH